MKKLKVLVEMEKLHNTNSGLGQFCLGLGQALTEQNKKNDLHFLVPENKANVFGNNAIYILLKNYLSNTIVPQSYICTSICAGRKIHD